MHVLIDVLRRTNVGHPHAVDDGLVDGDLPRLGVVDSRVGERHVARVQTADDRVAVHVEDVANVVGNLRVAVDGVDERSDAVAQHAQRQQVEATPLVAPFNVHVLATVARMVVDAYAVGGGATSTNVILLVVRHLGSRYATATVHTMLTTADTLVL